MEKPKAGSSAPSELYPKAGLSSQAITDHPSQVRDEVRKGLKFRDKTTAEKIPSLQDLEKSKRLAHLQGGEEQKQHLLFELQSFFLKNKKKEEEGGKKASFSLQDDCWEVIIFL